jgi:sugar O-acyltransferase (sialic acid O-acetyltransferase NeuD family)
MTVPVTIPLVNSNEPEALLAELYVIDGQQLNTGDLICTLETTKSTADLFAESPGYFLGLQFEVGDTVLAGDILGYLAETQDWEPLIKPGESKDLIENDDQPEGLRMTKPALALAHSSGLDLALLPKDILVTESTVKAALETIKNRRSINPVKGIDPTAILIYGAGGHGKSLLELIQALETFSVIGFIDDGVPKGEIVMGIPVLGDKGDLPDLYAQGIRMAVNAVGGIGHLRIREVVFRSLLDAGFNSPSVVHPTAFLEASSILSKGVQVFPFAYVGSAVEIGFGSIVNSGAIISHECILGELVNISPGAILAGGVFVGDGALIGMGVTVNLQVKVGAGARVGNGATIKSDVPEKGVVPAGSTWPH